MRALLVVDLQRYFLETGSAEKINKVPGLIEKTNELIKYFESKNLPIFKIQTIHKADRSTWNLWALENDTGRLIEGTTEAEFSPDVYVADKETVIPKTRLSAFVRTQLEYKLKAFGCKEVIICGYSTDYCVGQTAIDAYEHDFKVTLAEDAILGTKVKYHNIMLDSLKRRFEIIPKSNKEIML